MITRFFESLNPIPFILILIYGVFIGIFIDYQILIPNNDYNYSGVILNYLSNNLILARFIFVIIVLFNTFLIRELVNYFDLLPTKTLVPSFIYLSSIALLNKEILFTSLILISPIILYIILKILSLYKEEGRYLLPFNLGLLIGLASIINISIMWIYFLIIISIGILRTLKFQEFLISFLGFITPIYLVYSIKYLTDGSLNIISFSIYDNFKSSDFNLIISISIILLLSLISVYKMSSFFMKGKIGVRKSYIVFMIYSIITITTSFFVYEGLFYILVLLLPVFSILFSGYISLISRKWISEILLIIIILLSVVSVFV